MRGSLNQRTVCGGIIFAQSGDLFHSGADIPARDAGSQAGLKNWRICDFCHANDDNELW